MKIIICVVIILSAITIIMAKEAQYTAEIKILEASQAQITLERTRQELIYDAEVSLVYLDFIQFVCENEEGEERRCWMSP